jgi:hypothetical protein
MKKRKDVRCAHQFQGSNVCSGYRVSIVHRKLARGVVATALLFVDVDGEVDCRYT